MYNHGAFTPNCLLVAPPGSLHGGQGASWQKWSFRWHKRTCRRLTHDWGSECPRGLVVRAVSCSRAQRDEPGWWQKLTVLPSLRSPPLKSRVGVLDSSGSPPVSSCCRKWRPLQGQAPQALSSVRLTLPRGQQGHSLILGLARN